jgi:dTDP-6-deoxy-L-talose 4-dehydrogenase (NAD+)
MKVAIIGGTSFIGQNLIKHLQKKIRIIATYNSNKPIKNELSIAWKKLDIRENKKNYLKYLEYPDIVLNLAWPDIPNYRLKKHFKTFYYQKKFNHNLIKNGLKNLIVLGTCYEYGKINGKISETITEKPTIPYAKSKLKLLRSILELKKNNYFKFTWLRPFFVYGYNKKRKNLYSLIKEIDKNRIEKLQVCGNLIRDFISIKLLCSIIFKIIMLNKDLGILNLCSGKGTTVKSFIKKNLKNKKNLKKINMNFKNPNNFEPKYFWGDNSKLKKIFKKVKFKSNY